MRLSKKCIRKAKKRWQLHNPGVELQKLHGFEKFIGAWERALEAVKSSTSSFQKPTTPNEAHGDVKVKSIKENLMEKQL